MDVPTDEEINKNDEKISFIFEDGGKQKVPRLILDENSCFILTLGYNSLDTKKTTDGYYEIACKKEELKDIFTFLKDPSSLIDMTAEQISQLYYDSDKYFNNHPEQFQKKLLESMGVIFRKLYDEKKVNLFVLMDTDDYENPVLYDYKFTKMLYESKRYQLDILSPYNSSLFEILIKLSPLLSYYHIEKVTHKFDTDINKLAYEDILPLELFDYFSNIQSYEILDTVIYTFKRTENPNLLLDIYSNNNEKKHSLFMNSIKVLEKISKDNLKYIFNTKLNEYIETIIIDPKQYSSYRYITDIYNDKNYMFVNTINYSLLRNIEVNFLSKITKDDNYDEEAINNHHYLSIKTLTLDYAEDLDMFNVMQKDYVNFTLIPNLNTIEINCEVSLKQLISLPSWIQKNHFKDLSINIHALNICVIPEVQANDFAYWVRTTNHIVRFKDKVTCFKNTNSLDYLCSLIQGGQCEELNTLWISSMFIQKPFYEGFMKFCSTHLYKQIKTLRFSSLVGNKKEYHRFWGILHERKFDNLESLQFYSCNEHPWYTIYSNLFNDIYYEDVSQLKELVFYKSQWSYGSLRSFYRCVRRGVFKNLQRFSFQGIQLPSCENPHFLNRLFLTLCGKKLKFRNNLCKPLYIDDLTMANLQQIVLENTKYTSYYRQIHVGLSLMSPLPSTCHNISICRIEGSYKNDILVEIERNIYKNTKVLDLQIFQIDSDWMNQFKKLLLPCHFDKLQIIRFILYNVPEEIRSILNLSELQQLIPSLQYIDFDNNNNN
ncbi:hypothetical protein WA158_006768 [Blastocystis sp. Blastoise]